MRLKHIVFEIAVGTLIGAGLMASFLFLGLRAKAAGVDTPELVTVPRHEIADMLTAEDWEPPYTQSDLELLAAITYAEAGDQDFEGMRLVADCICNRVRSDQFPGSIEGVVYQSGQFSPVTDGGLNRAWGNVSADCYEAARLALTGNHLDTNVLYFSMYYCANGVYAYQHGDHYFGY